MPATPKSLRQPPPRNFEDYSLTYETSPELGLFPIKNEQMRYVPGTAGSPTPAGTFTYTSDISLNFSINFSGVVCDKVAISTQGWIALQPTNYSFVVGDYFTSGQFTDPSKIYVLQGALLAPWFTTTIFNNYRFIEDVDPLDISTIEKSDLALGKVTIDKLRQCWVDSTAGGIKFFNGECDKGRYFLVRWNSILTPGGSLLQFDTVIYESGVVEYRYNKIPVIANTSTTPTAIGIWMPQSNTVYRDFSNYLKEDVAVAPGHERVKYKYGGAVWNGTYADSLSPTTPYSVSVDHVDHWPAKGDNGAVFRFAPPVNKRRNNRRTIAARDSKPISPAGTFDDRKTTYFVADTVSYPAGLPVNRPYTTSYKGVHSTLDLFSLSDIELQREPSAAMYDQHLEETHIISDEDGFSETSLHEQGIDDEFYLIGSPPSIGSIPGTFSSGLKNKQTIRLSLPVNVSTRMLNLTSSIYYYNKSGHRWNVPTMAIDEFVPQFDAFSFDTRWSPGYGSTSQAFTPGSVMAEDTRGFDAYGRPVASGSLAIYRTVFTSSNPNTYNQTIPLIGRANATNAQSIESILDFHPKSVFQNQKYRSTEEELLDVPLDQPFMLEKAVLEIPFGIGESWFSDLTSTNLLLVSGNYSDSGTHINDQFYMGYDRGGPTITVSLLCQKKQGTNTVMEIIASGTITHVNDTEFVKTCLIYEEEYAPIPMVVATKKGLRGPSARISTNSGNTFTGSVKIPITAAVSNGTTACLSKLTSMSDTAPIPAAYASWNPVSILQWMSQSLSSRVYSLSSTDASPDSFVTLGINPLGRALQGLTPGGGSMFGGDNVTYPEKTSKDCLLSNPFYIEDEVTRNFCYLLFSSSLESMVNAYPATTMTFAAAGDVDLQGHKISPYLIKPGDKLILAVSKARPSADFVRASITGSAAADIGLGRAEKILKFSDQPVMEGLPICILEDVVPHDVTLLTGTIHMSLYGSYVGAGIRSDL